MNRKVYFFLPESSCQGIKELGYMYEAYNINELHENEIYRWSLVTRQKQI